MSKGHAKEGGIFLFQLSSFIFIVLVMYMPARADPGSPMKPPGRYNSGLT
jgi:hypothetical protein